MEFAMKKTLSIIAFLAVAAVACEKFDISQNNEGLAPEGMITETVTAINGDSSTSTRADIAADASFSWSAGDRLAVHVSDGKYYTTEALTAGGSGAATFSVTYPDGQSRDAFAIYPASIVAADAANYGQSGTALDVTLPGSYTLAQVSGTATPCPMIAANTGSGWTFKQLCGMLRLTVNGIPSAAKRLEIDFDGKKVCGDFSIAPSVTPGSSVISIPDDPDYGHDIITITKNGSNTTLGATDLVLNIPLPTGVYNNITVVAYDALTGGSPLKCQNASFNYMAKRAYGKKIDFSDLIDPVTSFRITFKHQGNNLGNNLRFVRMFSNLNKLHNGATTYGPYATASVGTSDPDISNPVSADLLFDKNPDDLLAFQVITSDGKVYSGSCNVPAGGFKIGKSYDLTVPVNPYTFTVASDKKVYFSPGDLGVDGGTFSFTEPFETWGWGNGSATKRVWFNYGEITGKHAVYGIDWRNPNSLTTSTSSPTPQEWDNIIGRTMNTDVSAYYRVSVSGHANCLLLPPDEAVSTDIGDDIKSGTVTDYAKYLGKGFVLLISTGRATVSSNKFSWGSATQGWYWALWNNMGRNRTYFSWTVSAAPTVTWATSQFRMRVRFVLDVE